MLLSIVSCPQDLPQAPAGYEWYVFEAGKAAYLKPDGWFVKVESEKGTDALFISKENIDEQGEFRTGMTVNVVREFKSRQGRIPSAYADSYIASLGELYKLLEVERVPPNSGITGIRARYRDTSRKPHIMIATLLIADDQADTLRILIFESPERDWQKAWVHGELMLKGQLWR